MLLAVVCLLLIVLLFVLIVFVLVPVKQAGKLFALLVLVLVLLLFQELELVLDGGEAPTDPSAAAEGWRWWARVRDRSSGGEVFYRNLT